MIRCKFINASAHSKLLKSPLLQFILSFNFPLYLSIALLLYFNPYLLHFIGTPNCSFAKLQFGVPIKCNRYGLKYNNNAIERYNGKLKDRMNCRRGDFKS